MQRFALLALVFIAGIASSKIIDAATANPLDEPMVVTKRMWCDLVCSMSVPDQSAVTFHCDGKTITASYGGYDPSKTSVSRERWIRTEATRKSNLRQGAEGIMDAKLKRLCQYAFEQNLKEQYVGF